MAFLDSLTEKERNDLKYSAEEYPVIAKLCAELKTYEEDSIKGFYAALNIAIKSITDAIHDGSLDLDTPYMKSVVKLAEVGNKIFDSLSRGKQEATGEKFSDFNTPDGVTKGSVSLIDKLADDNKKKL
jgi:hypothetical protein